MIYINKQKITNNYKNKISMHSTPPQRFQSNKKIKLFPCVICQKLTDQTCSLCRKVFYCSAQHQQIDWHMKHKLQCEGKIIQTANPAGQNTNNRNTYQSSANNTKDREFFIPQNRQIQFKSNQIRLQNQSRQFMNLFEQRLILRKKCIDKYIKFTQQTSNPRTSNNQLSSQLQQLNQTSQNLRKIFKSSFIPILQQTYGITTSQFILKLDQILDKSLLAKYQLLLHQHEQVRRFLFTVNQQLPLYPNFIVDSRFRQVYENVLNTVMKISEVHCNDKVTEAILAKYIVLVQKFDGLSQKVYVYFNMGNWYLKKTYYQKSLKCLKYSLDLISSHKVRQPTQNSNLIKADLMFNMALCQYALNDQKQAFNLMQQSYRLRTKSIGKNSIQSSECLQCLAKWAFTNKYWQDCLQYAKQCYRVRKLNINYPKQLQNIQILLEDIHNELRKQKQKNQEELNFKPAKYYQSLISPSSKNQDKFSNQIQDSFVKQLNSINGKQQLLPFKIHVTPELAQTHTSNQWQKLIKLMQMDGRMMQKQQIRRIIFQSQYTDSLNQNQKDVFIKLNKIE